MTIAYDPDRHEAVAALLRRSAAAIAAELAALDASVEHLRPAWSGAARVAYDGAHRQWSETMAELQRALMRSTAAATEAGELLTRAERDAAARWS